MWPSLLESSILAMLNKSTPQNQDGQLATDQYLADTITLFSLCDVLFNYDNFLTALIFFYSIIVCFFTFLQYHSKVKIIVILKYYSEIVQS